MPLNVRRVARPVPSHLVELPLKCIDAPLHREAVLGGGQVLHRSRNSELGVLELLTHSASLGRPESARVDFEQMAERLASPKTISPDGEAHHQKENAHVAVAIVKPVREPRRELRSDSAAQPPSIRWRSIKQRAEPKATL
eukprot:scaffold1954_cov268-Pinguiococcus_pyrenoidosus.AAC.16